MTDLDVNQMVNDYLDSGGTITKRKRAVWAKGARLRPTQPVAKKYLTYSKAYSGPVGLTSLNYKAAGDRAGGYNTKYMMDSNS